MNIDPYKYGDRVRTLRDLEFHGGIAVAAGSVMTIDHAMLDNDGYYSCDTIPSFRFYRYPIHENDLELVEAFVPKL
jgi:hypothetical protein